MYPVEKKKCVGENVFQFFHEFSFQIKFGTPVVHGIQPNGPLPEL